MFDLFVINQNEITDLINIANMLVGEDFEKISFEFLGLDLLEPNAMFGDFLICCVSIYLAFRVNRLTMTQAFFIKWKYFFFIFGISFLVGGLAHLLYNYWGVNGKIPNLTLSVVATFYIEQAMLSLYDNKVWKSRLIIISKVKLAVALLAYALLFYFVDLESDISKSLTIAMINSSTGLIFALGFLGYQYSKRISHSFKYLWMGLLVIFPSIFLQVFKINFHQWFDRNDASHILLIASLLLYFKGIDLYSQSLKAKN